jgi:hypothetical protein
MRRYNILSGVISLVLFVGAYVSTFADDGYKKNYLHADFDKMTYDDSRQKYYEVIIQAVWKAPWKHDNGDSTGIYIKVSSDRKSYLVPVAPCWYFDSMDNFKTEKQITVFGVEYVIRGEKIILPKLIKNGSDDLWLRNYDGKPFWLTTSKNDDPRKTGPNGQRGPGQGGPGGGGGGGMGGMGGGMNR